MPIYEYRCKDCEQIFEEWQTGHEERTVDCPVCGAQAERIISNTSFVLKGTGWYVTDYSNGRSSQSVGTPGGNGNGDGTSSDASGSGADAPAKAETPPKSAKDSGAKNASTTAQS